MDDMRNMLRRHLGRSLGALPELSRLEAAWPVACGTRMAGRGRLTGYAEGTLTVEVEDEFWLAELHARGPVLERELARIAAVPLRGIHFSLKYGTHRHREGRERA